ncbi:MAG: CBS domain-containing protein [Halobacteriota archaeon]|nr:CBS domain-containing protein [Halobacteriota archaeon]
MKSSIELGKVMGIPIRLHITFLLVLPLFVLAFAEVSPAPFGFKGSELRYLFSMAVTVLLFSCVVFHELSHSYVAIKNGISINSITLFIFGGIASIEKIPRDPNVESRMALAGPGMSVALGTLFFSLYMFSASVLDSTSGLDLLPVFYNSLFNPNGYDVSVSEITVLFFILGYLNVVLAIFNLLPAFPMDGGRFLRAFFAKRMPYLQATKRAVYFGKVMAVLMGIFGVFTNPFLVLIAFFVYIGASEEEKATIIDVSLEGTKVKDLMTEEVITVSPRASVTELTALMFKEKHMGYPVVDEETFGGREVLGIVTFHDIRKIPMEKRGTLRVSDIMSRDVVYISSEDNAINALKLMTKHDIGRLIVKEDGIMTGILSKTDLMKAIELKRER